MRLFCLLLLTAVLVFATSSVDSALDNFSLWLTAHPQAIVADSHSFTTVSAELRDSSGRALPDGTGVDFTTSLGIIEQRALTIAGVARVQLQSGATVGTAMVSAVCASGNAVAQLKVDFLASGTEMFTESFITVSSKTYLGYDVGGRKVEAAGGVSIYSRGLTIDADEAEIDVTRNVLRAKCKNGGENIVIKKRGEKQIEASVLFYDFCSMSGVILTPVDQGAKRRLVRGRDLFTESDAKPDKLATFDFKPATDPAMFIKAKSILIQPGEEVKIKHASFYVQGSKVPSVPLYVIKLKGQGAGAGQMLNYGSDGLQLDMPFYYSLTPTTTGSIRLKHSEPTGWGYTSGPTGWEVDLNHEYNTGGASDGVFSVDHVTSATDWGMSRNQRKELGNQGMLSTYLDFPEHQDLYSTMNYSQPLGKYTLSWDFQGSKVPGVVTDLTSGVYLQSQARPLLGKDVSLRVQHTSRLRQPGFRRGGMPARDRRWCPVLRQAYPVQPPHQPEHVADGLP